MLPDPKLKHTTPQAIGCFGGRFDPVHRAHLAIAQAAADELGLAQLRWIVTATPPHKPAVATAEHRLAMVQLALAELNDPRMVIDDREIQTAARGKPNFTADTIAHLQADFPGRRFIWILGEDQLQAFTTWSRWQWLIQHMELAICARPGALGSRAAHALENLGATLHWIRVDPDPVSSSQIRKAVLDRTAFGTLTTARVADYIKRTGLYTS